MQIDKELFYKQLCNYKPSGADETQHHEAVLSFVKTVAEPFSRSTLVGHLTASAWILSPDKASALLIHHQKLNLWFQPGGHLESADKSVIEAAEREAVEETGVRSLTRLSDQIFDIDVHTIPERKEVPEHLHYDIRYLFQSATLALAPDLSEVKDVKWVNISSWISAHGTKGSVGRMMSKTLST